MKNHDAITALGAVGLVVAAVVGVALMALLDGNPAMLLVLPIAALAAVAFVRLPVNTTMHVVLFVALLIDNTTERPGRNLFRSPLYAPGLVMYETLSKSLHLPIKFTGLQLLVLLMFSVIGLRNIFAPKRQDEPASIAQPVVQFCLIAMVDLLAMLVWGLGRGGQMNYAIVQMQTMFFVPVMTLLFAMSFKTAADVKRLLSTFVVVGYLRAVMCIFYWITVVRHQTSDGGGEGGDGSYVTTHSDSILATVAVLICILRIYQAPRIRSYVQAGLILPVVGLGIIANNRRIAFVAIALGLFFSYLASHGAFRKRVHQTVLALTPVLVLYFAAGWNAHGSWAKPVQSLRSVVEQKDASSETRDIENYNLLQTLKVSPIVGSGFGHKYRELVKAYDISTIFEAYRYVPHNSVLWFWSAGGLIGFTFYWMFISVGVFTAARVVKVSQSMHERTLGMVAIGAVCAWGAQSFGDMGLMSWMGGLIVASSMGATAAVASQNGAWAKGYTVGDDEGTAYDA